MACNFPIQKDGFSSFFSTVLRGISLHPFSGDAVVLFLVMLKLLGNFGYERVVGIGVGEQRANGQQHFGNGERRRPFVLENVEADGAVAVNVAMVDARAKDDFGALEWIFDGKGNVEKENASRVGRVFGSHDGGHPFENVVALGSGRAVARRVDATSTREKEEEKKEEKIFSREKKSQRAATVAPT